MNVLEIYKLLPRTNCGRCAQKQCMAFSVALAKGDAMPSGCTEVSETIHKELDRLGGSGDWRESLIADLRKEVSAIHFPDIASGLGAGMNGDSLSIRCLGRDFLITPTGEVSSQGPLTPWMQILLLHYIRTRGSVQLSDRWVSYSELKSGMVKATSFSQECEEPLREFFDRMKAPLERILEGLGASRLDNMPAPSAWKLFALPRVPVLILYWPSDDEFASKLKILFDATADHFLDVESLMFLLEGLVRNAEAVLLRTQGQ